MLLVISTASLLSASSALFRSLVDNITYLLVQTSKTGE